MKSSLLAGRLAAVALFLSILAFPSLAQRPPGAGGGFGGNRPGFERSSFRLSLTLVDSLTREPIPFASVYLVPVKDTIITAFTLTDQTGSARINQITRGDYDLNVEFVGYTPIRKNIYFRRDMNLDTLRMKVDENFLEAAKVTAIGTPVDVRKDTIIYNASSFKTLDNAMLEDLLKRMPGIEVDGNSVTVNGEEVSKITVNGKVFFFDNKESALKNLPAKMVDKVKVIDQESEKARDTGIADDKKEKVMDVQLKEEYKKGWFGNLKASAGANVPPEDHDELVPDGKFLYNLNALTAVYNETDQLTVVGNTYNVPDGRSGAGLRTSSEVSANINTDRISSVESSAMVSYGRNTTETRSKSSTTTFTGKDEDLYSDSDRGGKTSSNSLRANMRFRKSDKSNLAFNFEPQIVFERGNSSSSSKSNTLSGSTLRNSSVSSSGSESDSFSAGMKGSVTFKNLGSKRGRSIGLDLSGALSDTDGTSYEYSSLTTEGSSSIKDIDYDVCSGAKSLGLGLSYVEPVSSTLMLQLSGGTSLRSKSSDNQAFNASDRSENDYYSSWSRNSYRSDNARLQMQYKKDDINLQAGAEVFATVNEIHSRSLGVETVTGEGETLWNWSPFINFTTSFKNVRRFRVRLSGTSYDPSASDITPNLNISNRTRIRAGNIYLKPYFSSNLNLSMAGGDTRKQTFFAVNGNLGLGVRNVVTASWHDSDGVAYTLPVNTRKPALNASINGSGGFPLNKSQSLAFQGSAGISFRRTISYQNISRSTGIDLENFDYNDFISEIWGNDGDAFYDGTSGFAESVTTTVRPVGRAGLTYKGETWNITLSDRITANISRYSLDSRSNRSTVDNTLSLNMQYFTDSGWQANMEGSYYSFSGYSDGYGEPYFMLNAGIFKNIKAFSFGISANDILGQGIRLNRTISENYISDSSTLQLGRYILATFTYNFGKMNAKQSRRAQNVARGTAF